MHDSLRDNPRRLHGFEPLRVEGTLPVGLDGTLFRTGPGMPERFGRRVRHPFEADGLMSAVRLRHGEATGAVQPVRGPGWREEEAAGRPLYSSAAGVWDRLRAVFTGRSKATGNTSMWAWNGALYALMEGTRPVRIAPETLDTHDVDDLGGVVAGAFSAHPHRVAALNCTFNFGCRYRRTMEVDLFALPDGGHARRLTTIEVPFNAMVHDFAATETHLLLFVCPAKLRPLRALLGVGGFDSWFRWDPAEGTHVYVVPLDDPDRPTRFNVDPFWFFHVSNAWTEGGEVVVDLCRYDDLSSLASVGGADTSAPPHLHRCRLGLGDGRWRTEQLVEHPVEFPHVHPRVEGARHAHTFGLTILDHPGHYGIVAVGGEAWTPHAAEQASEPVLVPRGDAEDDVWVLTLVHDDRSDCSYVAVLDGQRLADGPVARVWFDQTLPTTFHGTWVA